MRCADPPTLPRRHARAHASRTALRTAAPRPFPPLSAAASLTLHGASRNFCARLQVKDNKQNCFYRAALRDVDDGKGKALIQFESKTGFDQEQTWLPLSTIRQVPVHSAPMRAADLKTDTIVEVKCSADGDLEPPSWWEAKVRSVKGEFVNLQFLDAAATKEVAELDRIRPAYSYGQAGAMRLPELARQVYKLPDATVHKHFLSNEGRIADDVCSKAGVFSLAIDPKAPRATLLGAKKDCATAIMLLDLHAKHLGELKRVEQVRQQLASKLQTERDRLDSSHRLEFSIKKDLVGLVVGKGGKTIQEAKATTGVDRVDVFGSDSEPRVVITASSREKAEACRELLEYTSERVPVKADQIGWLIGTGGKSFRAMQEATKVTRLNVDKARSEVRQAPAPAQHRARSRRRPVAPASPAPLHPSSSPAAPPALRR